MTRGRLIAMGTLFSVVASWSPRANATALAVLRTQSEIVMAADSLALTELKESSEVCKINGLEGTIFTYSGLSTDISGLDVTSLARSALKVTGSLSEQVARFDHLIMPPLQTAVDRIRTGDKTGIEVLYRYSVVLSIIFANVENGIPTVYNQRFTISRSDPMLKVEENLCPGEYCPEGKLISLVGPSKFKEQFYEAHQDLSGNLVDMARTFIQDQINDHVNGVAPPIDIVRLVAHHGIEWIQRKPVCW
jgi:hypothetical protein